MLYTYFASNNKRHICHGLIRGKNENAVTELLTKKGLTVFSTMRVRFWPRFFDRVGHIDLLLFLKNVSLLLKAGISLGEVLTECASLVRGRNFKKIVSSMAKEVSAGNSFANTLINHPLVFDRGIVNLFHIAEESGNLVETADRVAGEQDRRFELKKKIAASAAYPLIVLGVALGLLILFFLFVIPRLSQLFISVGLPIPISIAFFISLGNFTMSYALWIAACLLILIYLLPLILRLPPVDLWWGKIKLALPVFGSVVRAYNSALFARTMSIVLGSGIDMVRSLTIVGESMNNPLYSRSLFALSKKTAAGQSLHESLAAEPLLYSSLMIKIISAGERSGNLESSFSYMGDFYDRELNYATRNLTVILEPVLLIIVGLLIGSLALSVITPIYDFVSRVGR